MPLRGRRYATSLTPRQMLGKVPAMRDNDLVSMHVKAAIYARISSDKSGLGLGVQRQQEDCQRLAADKGWLVTATYVENDVSAFSGKHRPEYEALLHAIEAGEVDVVIAWSHDRLHRRPTELEHYLDICERGKVDTYTVKAGHLDLTTPSGRAVARTLAAWASYETETSTARVKAAKAQQAQSGGWSGGQRPWGYEPACVAIRQPEADLYIEAVDRVISGWSFNRVAIDWNERGITTQHGKTWNSLKLRNLLLHKRYAGIREHNGTDYPATWPAVITVEKYEALQAAIARHRSEHKQHGPVRRNLLTGYVFCGRCDGRMSSGQRGDGEPRYVCTHCYRILRMVAPVDLLVKESILYRLDTPDLGKLLGKGEKDDTRLKELLLERNKRRQRLNELTDDYMAGLFTKTELTRAKTAADAALLALDRQISAVTRQQAGMNLLPVGQTIREAWDSNDLAWRRQLIGLLIERVVLKPSPGAAHLPKSQLWNGFRFRPTDVDIRWAA